MFLVFIFDGLKLPVHDPEVRTVAPVAKLSSFSQAFSFQLSAKAKMLFQLSAKAETSFQLSSAAKAES